MPPPINVFTLGISLTPNHGIQTHRMPPNTSVRERSVRSAAGKYFAFEEYKIKAEQTKKPCNVESEVFFNDIKILLSFKNKINIDTKAAKTPPIDTVVNFGVFFLHLSETVKAAKANCEINPLTKPNNVPLSLLSNEINITPTAAINMEIKVVVDIFSFKKM